jgi:hypothetical protein
MLLGEFGSFQHDKFYSLQAVFLEKKTLHIAPDYAVFVVLQLVAPLTTVPIFSVILKLPSVALIACISSEFHSLTAWCLPG